MAATTATVIGIAGLVIGAAGAGYSAYGQEQQAKAQNAINQFNALQQEKQAKLQLSSMQTQAALQKQQAEANFKLRSAESQARLNNADAIDDQALAQDAINRVNLRKRREDFASMQAGHRASIAASGVAESVGTPLDLLAETAAKIQLDQEEQLWAGEAQRRTLFSEAATERLGGRLALAGATLDRDSGVATAALKSVAGKAEYQGNMRAAEITKLTGSAAEVGSQYKVAATLFGGVTDAAAGYVKQFPAKKETTVYNSKL